MAKHRPIKWLRPRTLRFDGQQNRPSTAVSGSPRGERGGGWRRVMQNSRDEAKCGYSDTNLRSRVRRFESCRGRPTSGLPPGRSPRSPGRGPFTAVDRCLPGLAVTRGGSRGDCVDVADAFANGARRASGARTR
jgi:hypothetical protein